MRTLDQLGNPEFTLDLKFLLTKDTFDSIQVEHPEIIFPQYRALMSHVHLSEVLPS